MKHLIVLLLSLLACEGGAQSLEALGAEEKGLAIAREAERRDSGYGDSRVRVRMTLRNRKGEESTRRLRVRTLEVVGDGDKTLSIFDAPADIKGTALLTFSHGLRADDQWLYLPALKRVKRIASRNKSGPFVGSEFAYEDIGSQEVEKYTYRWLRDEPCGDQWCFVIERYPAYEYSGYTRQTAWIDRQGYRVQRVEYYDRKGALLKTLSFKDYRQYLDQYWRAMVLFMQNHQTGKSTRLVREGFAFRTGLADRDFDRASLRRAR